MNKTNDEICKCDCHTKLIIMKHIMPCCDKCLICGERIKLIKVKKHSENCGTK